MADPTSGDRLWLIQCKRERTISPARVRKHLNEIPAESLTDLYGVIFAACCDFSKKTRDAFNDWCREKGISEGHIWGRAEIEDKIYQPKNDHILFAYFGISLQVRRRSVKTELRARLATKRKCDKVLHPYMEILLRDPEEERYPFLPSEEEENQSPVQWRIVKLEDRDPRGICFIEKQYFAYIGDDGESWDYVESHNLAATFDYRNSWIATEEAERLCAEQYRIRTFWNGLLKANRATYYTLCMIPFDEILAIDEKGDDYAPFPHLYVSTRSNLLVYQCLERDGERRGQRFGIDFDPEKRVSIFPKDFPEPSAETEEGA